MGRGRLTGILAAAVAVVAAVPAATPAHAALRWSDAQTLGPRETFPNSVHIDARGDVLAIWHSRENNALAGTFYAWRAPRGKWTETRELNVPRTFNGLSVALAPRGQAVAAWNDGRGRIVAATSGPGGTFDEPEVVATGGGELGAARIAIDDAGNALLAWTGDADPAVASGIVVATRRAGGAWSEPVELKGGGTGSAPSVAMNPAGAAAVAWMTSENGLPQVAYRQPAGSFGPAERPPLDRGPVFPLSIALDDAGRVHLAAPSAAFTIPVRTRLVSRSPLGGWGEPHEFETGGSPAAMLVAPDGTVNLLMDNHEDREHPKVQHASVRPDGTAVGPTTLALDSAGSDAAMNLRGDVLAAWEHPWVNTGGTIEAAGKPAALPVFGPGLPISDPTSVDPHVALNDAGQAAVMWAIGGYGNPAIQVAVRDDPKLPILPFPPAIGIDLPDVPAIDPDGDLPIDVRCAVSCKVTPRGVLAPGAGEDLRSGRGKTRRLKAKRRGSVTVDFGTAGASAVRAARAKGGKATVYLTVRARGKSPRPITISRRVRLR